MCNERYFCWHFMANLWWWNGLYFNLTFNLNWWYPFKLLFQVKNLCKFLMRNIPSFYDCNIRVFDQYEVHFFCLYKIDVVIIDLNIIQNLFIIIVVDQINSFSKGISYLLYLLVFIMFNLDYFACWLSLA